jgi:glycerol-3-phosphate O-acyltransferase
VTDTAELGRAASGLAEQYLLQRRIYCADAVSTSYADGAIRLAGHRGLLASRSGVDLAERRAEFADELHELVRRARTTQARAAERFLEVMRGH